MAYATRIRSEAIKKRKRAANREANRLKRQQDESVRELAPAEAKRQAFDNAFAFPTQLRYPRTFHYEESIQLRSFMPPLTRASINEVVCI